MLVRGFFLPSLPRGVRAERGVPAETADVRSVGVWGAVVEQSLHQMQWFQLVTIYPIHNFWPSNSEVI